MVQVKLILSHNSCLFVFLGLKTYFVKGRKNNTEITKGTLTVSSLSSKDPSPSSQPRRSSISLATAISIHINKSAVLEEVLNSSQSFSPRTPSPEELSHSPTHSLYARSRSPIHRVLNLSSPWKTTSLPSILDTEGNEHSDVISIKDEYLYENSGSSLLTMKKTNQKWLYEKVQTSDPPGNLKIYILTAFYILAVIIIVASLFIIRIIHR